MGVRGGRVPLERDEKGQQHEAVQEVRERQMCGCGGDCVKVEDCLISNNLSSEALQTLIPSAVYSRYIPLLIHPAPQLLPAAAGSLSPPPHPDLSLSCRCRWTRPRRPLPRSEPSGSWRRQQPRSARRLPRPSCSGGWLPLTSGRPRHLWFPSRLRGTSRPPRMYAR